MVEVLASGIDRDTARERDGKRSVEMITRPIDLITIKLIDLISLHFQFCIPNIKEFPTFVEFQTYDLNS